MGSSAANPGPSPNSLSPPPLTALTEGCCCENAHRLFRDRDFAPGPLRRRLSRSRLRSVTLVRRVGGGPGRITTSGGGPVLTISKSAPASVVSGQNLTYALTYGNTGSGDAAGVVINDTGPAGGALVLGAVGGAGAAGGGGLENGRGSARG